MYKRLILIVLLFALWAGSVSAGDKISAFVSIVPQKYFVQQIGKDWVDVKIMVKPGSSPATYEPKPRQMAELSKAILYFSIGVPFENAWLEKLSAANPQMKVVHTDHGIEKIAMAEYHHEGEDDHQGEHHGKTADKGEAHHDHTGLDPHIWTAPALVKIQAKAILKALQEAAPRYADEFQANYDSFAARIDGLDQELKQAMAGKKGLQFMVFHPSWGYFAKAYGLTQVPIEIEGKNPKPAQLKALINHAKEDGIRVIFVQPQFSTKSAKLIAGEIGGEVAFADPLAEDWMKNLRMIADKFKAVLK
jgi:zinc transport system substrate-binding protein